MTDRVYSLTVVLKEDIRVDDIESLEAAIRWMSPVLKVERNIADHVSFMAEERAIQRAKTRLWNAIRDLDKENV